MSLNGVQCGRGCHVCNSLISEKICRKYFEYILDKIFIKIRPKFLCTSNKTYLELDGYNDELKLGWEYNGLQHYKYIKYFHKNINNFTKRVKYDKLKKELCNKNNIKLVIIPYYIKYNKMQKYITKKCIELNIPITNYKYIDYTNFNIYNVTDKHIKLDNILSKNGFIRMSPYISNRCKVKIKCTACKTIYEKYPKHIKHIKNNQLKCKQCTNNIIICNIKKILKKYDYQYVSEYITANFFKMGQI